MSPSIPFPPWTAFSHRYVFPEGELMSISTTLKGVGAIGQLYRIFTEGNVGIRVFPSGAWESDRIVLVP